MYLDKARWTGKNPQLRWSSIVDGLVRHDKDLYLVESWNLYCLASNS